jgi:hypothetical protein
MPRVRVSQLPSKVPPRVGATYAYLFWFVPVLGLNHLPERPRGGGVDPVRVVPPKGLLVPC